MAARPQCLQLLQSFIGDAEAQIVALRERANSTKRALEEEGEAVQPLPVCGSCMPPGGSGRRKLDESASAPSPQIYATLIDLSASTRRRTQASVVDGIGTSLTCLPRVSFTVLSFEHASLVRSNLGGLGGRCSRAGRCVEGAPLASTPHEIYFANVGRVTSATGGGEHSLDVRIVNESQYRAWNVNINGIKRRRRDGVAGNFGVINLLGPRDSSQQPAGMRWNEKLFCTVTLRVCECDLGRARHPSANVYDILR